MKDDKHLFDVSVPSHEEVRKAVARAHQLRAQAIRDWTAALMSGIGRLFGRTPRSPAHGHDGAKAAGSAPPQCGASARGPSALRMAEVA